jgi:hypothetical protein
MPSRPKAQACRKTTSPGSVVNIRLEACRQPWALAVCRPVAGWARHAGAAAAAGSWTVPRAIVVVSHAQKVSMQAEHLGALARTIQLARILSGAVAFSPCLECSIAIDLAAEQPFDLQQPAQEDALAFLLETQNSTHDTLAFTTFRLAPAPQGACAAHRPA